MPVCLTHAATAHRPCRGAAQALLAGLLVLIAAACSSEETDSGGSVVADAAADTGGPNWGGKDTASAATDALAGDVPRDETTGTDVASGLSDAAGDVLDVSDSAQTDAGPVCANACQTNSDCPAVLGCFAPVCTDGCCTTEPLADAQPCDDGDPCTLATACTNAVCGGGVFDLCDDGKDCTIDGCAPGQGCTHTIDSDSCLIDGSCVGLAEFATNSVCLACEPTATATDWTSQPGCCKTTADCPVPTSKCEIVSCNKQSGDCEITKKPGCCDVDLDCNDGDRCTTDTCDTVTGSCTFTPVDCDDPSVCEIGVCLPETGKCGGQIKSGYCKVDGSCRLQGNVPDDNPCLVCNPFVAKDAWSPNPGILCDDGSTCTFSDACGVDGVCGGKGLPGCCEQDSDCPDSGDPCVASKCNPATKLCFQSPVASCCKDGLCCDVANNQLLPYGAPCSDQTLDQQYECQGGDVYQRWKRPACDGSGKDGCSQALEAWTEWVLLSDCGTGTVCNDPGTGIKPSCVPAGTCNGSCGGQSSNGACSCEPSCLTTGTCCPDYKAFCGCSSGDCCDLTQKVWRSPGSLCGGDVTQYRCDANVLQTRLGQGKCTGSGLCDPTAANFSAWGFAENCAGKKCVASADGSFGSCTTPPAGSCNGRCGGIGTGTCWCDSSCSVLGDCCTDFAAQGCVDVQSCGDLSSAKLGTCSGNCGSSSWIGNCYCDSFCASIGDCCPDKAECGCP